jgi:hypothetical protein
MQLSYRPALICANFSFNFLKKFVRDQRWPAAHPPPFGGFTAPLCHISPVYKVTIRSNDLFVNFRWALTFCVEKPYDGMHLAFGETNPVLPLPNEHG